uniref:Luciferin 4-monooxygenase n=1 Tax=Arion vulgaris TaxID=1028688 RepID=A0A0B6ZD64_9EUPU
MRHQVYHQCRRILVNDKLKTYATGSQYSKQNKTLLNSNVGHEINLVPRRLLTSQKESTCLISADNIIRSHLPDIVIPENVPFHEYMFGKCDIYKDLPAVTEFLTGRTYTYSQLKENSIRVASALHRLGYRKGDVLLSFSTNHMDISVLMLACASLGIVYSAANPTFTADELSRQLVDSGCLAVFTIPELSETVKEAMNSKSVQNKVKRAFVFGKSHGLQPFQSLLDDDGKGFPDVDIDPLKDVYVLPYSSGTTGLPKGVMLTHYNILANCLQMKASVNVHVGEPTLGLLPLYHIFGMVIVQYCALQNGGILVTLPKFDPEVFLKCIQDAKIELANLVPAVVNFMVKHPLVSKYDITSLRRVYSAAAPLGEGVTKEFLRRHTFGVTLAQGFGMTETSPATNVDTYGSACGSIGTMLVNTLGKIVDVENNKQLGPGEMGEYCVKGPQVMKGYFNNQKATDEIIKPDGWLHTGDIGYVTKDGFVYICDRMKELIKYKGSQVPPAELEALLLEHHDIADVAVIGIPDDRAGELPKAFVVKKNDAKVTEQDIVNFVKEKMAPSKRLHGGVQFVKDIPRNASGKIIRKTIKEKYVTVSRD